MIKKLTLENFKNFKRAELELGPFTILVGANATGKSNIREAFRFLHGIGRGYTVPDIIGEKWGQDGVRIWSGIRGGLREIIYSNPSLVDLTPQSLLVFSLDVHFNIHNSTQNLRYHIEINPKPGPLKPTIPVIKNEILEFNNETLFQVSQESSETSWELVIGEVKWSDYSVFHSPLLSQFNERWFEWEHMINEMQDDTVSNSIQKTRQFTNSALNHFKSMRFGEFEPDTLRKPSFPGQITLGDRGENLSSVLHEICQDEQKKRVLTEWVRELTPMDAIDFEFTPDQVGRILVTLVEKNGQKTSAYSASDGTLRFLGILAALLGPEPAQLYFFEEIENGIHPSRIHLLLELIEQVTSEGNIQVIATTHSPQLLGQVSEKTLENASLTYRLEGESDARIQRIVDIPDAKKIFEEEDLSRLYEQGWLENSVHFLKNGKAPA